MSDIADVLNRLNELGRDDLAEVVTCLMGERDNLAVRLSESETGELKNALAVGKAVLELSEARREADDLRAQLSEAQERLAEIGRQAPPCILANRCEALTTAPVPPAAVAVPDEYVLVPLAWFDREIPRLDAGGPNPITPDEHCCEWVLYQERERIHAAVAGLLAASPATVAQKVPDGFVLVPKEPTSDMLIAGFKQLFGGSDNDVVARAYRAMLAAAQAQEKP